MEKIKSTLRRFPKLYHFIQKYYGKIKFAKEWILKTNIDEKEEKRWEKRHLHEGENWAIEGYWSARTDSSTKFLVEEITKFYPFSSILEIGCNCGPNLWAISKKFPDVSIKGIDINKLAVQKGKELLKGEGIKNVELLIGKAYNLNMFPDKSFDIIFSKAVLVHIGPSKIKKVLEEMIRVSRKAIILVEYYEVSSNKNSDILGTRLNYSYRWKRDYVALVRKIIPESKIRLIKIPSEVWGEEWGEMGYIIEIFL